jgi:hypothetical protein
MRAPYSGYHSPRTESSAGKTERGRSRGGKVTASEPAPSRSSPPRPCPHLRYRCELPCIAVLASSAEICRELRRRTGRSVWVNAIVVWNEFPDGLIELQPITYLLGSRLLEWPKSKPLRLDRAAVGMFAAALWDLQTDRARPTAAGPPSTAVVGTRQVDSSTGSGVA